MYSERQGPSYTVVQATSPHVVRLNGAGVLYTSGCSGCMLMFGIFLTIAGTIMTAISYRKPSPPFDKPFFTKNDANNPLRTVGPVLLSIGLLLLISSVVLCCVMLSKRQRLQQQILQTNQVNTQAPPPPPSAYPHQLRTPYSPPSDFYQQNVPTSSYSNLHPVPTSAYPSQRNVPSSFRYQQNDIPPPSYCESLRDPQLNNPSKFNDPSGNDTFIHCIPSVPTFNNSGASPYHESQGK